MIMFLLNAAVFVGVVLAVVVLLALALSSAAEINWGGALQMVMAATFGLVGGYTLLGAVAMLLHGDIVPAAFALVIGSMGCFMAWALVTAKGE